MIFNTNLVNFAMFLLLIAFLTVSIEADNGHSKSTSHESGSGSCEDGEKCDEKEERGKIHQIGVEHHFLDSFELGLWRALNFIKNFSSDLIVRRVFAALI